MSKVEDKSSSLEIAKEPVAPETAHPPFTSRQAPSKIVANQLVSFEDRMTYTFMYGKEVGSIHFDRRRGEIFYKGHNLRNMDLEEWQMQTLEQLRRVLETDSQGRPFAEGYGRTLDKVLLEKKKK